MEKRFDRQPLKIVETGDGFIRVKATLLAPGVYDYYDEEKGLVKEAKLPEDIISIETRESALGAPITEDHPVLDGVYQFVTPDNYQLFAKGAVLAPIIEKNEEGEPVLNALTTVFDKDLIEKIKNKEITQVSPGFKHVPDNTPGTYKNQSYDSAQRKIIINHIAFLKEGRAGEKAKIHIDRRETAMADKQEYFYRKFDGSSDIMVNSKEALDELISLNKIVKEFDEKEKNYVAEKATFDEKEKDLTAKIETLTAEVAEWKNQFDALNKSIPEKAEGIAQERLALLQFVSSFDSSNLTGKSNRDIKLHVIANGLPYKEGTDLEKLTVEAIDSRFDAACDLIKAKANMSKAPEKAFDSGIINDQVINEKRAAMQKQFMGGQK